jgi:hypothetical protein
VPFVGIKIEGAVIAGLLHGIDEAADHRGRDSFVALAL